MTLRVRWIRYLPTTLLVVSVALILVSPREALPPYVTVGAVAIAGLAALILLVQALRRGRQQRLLAELRAHWGKAVERDRDFDVLSEQYDTYRAAEKDDALDDSTWFDLDLDEVYAAMDRTLTSVGELGLYVMLRNVVPGAEILEARCKAITRIQNDPALRDTLLARLHQLERDTQANLAGLLWNEKPVTVSNELLHKVLAVAAVLSLLTLIPLGLKALVFVIVPLFLVNSYVTHKAGGDVVSQLRSLRYLGKVVSAARDLASLSPPELRPWTTRLGHAWRETSAIARRVRVLNPEGELSTEILEMVTYHVSVYFLVEIRTYGRVMREIARHRDALKDVVRLVGELDGLQSVASYRSGLSTYCEPEIVDGDATLEIHDGWHPLLAKPVANSASFDDKNWFVTGSNMAGKTTFLRMVALNVILAQTVGTCCAQAYRGTFFRLASSISHRDEIESGTSYFLAEAERLLELARYAGEKGLPYLCVVDEMFRGTNSVERHAASLATLDYFAHTRALTLVASHDVELGQMLEPDYRLYHFAESFKQDRMEFDYRLKPGVCAVGNAIRTLAITGFPESIIADARRNLANILANGGGYLSPSEVLNKESAS